MRQRLTPRRVVTNLCILGVLVLASAAAPIVYSGISSRPVRDAPGSVIQGAEPVHDDWKQEKYQSGRYSHTEVEVKQTDTDCSIKITNTVRFPRDDPLFVLAESGKTFIPALEDVNNFGALAGRVEVTISTRDNWPFRGQLNVFRGGDKSIDYELFNGPPIGSLAFDARDNMASVINQAGYSQLGSYGYDGIDNGASCASAFAVKLTLDCPVPKLCVGHRDVFISFVKPLQVGEVEGGKPITQNAELVDFSALMPDDKPSVAFLT